MRRSGWFVVWRKEMLENARDRRALYSAMFYGPLLGPILFAGLIGLMIGQQREAAEKPLSLPVIGAEHAPNLVAYLQAQGIEIKPAPAEPEAAIRDQLEEAILRIPPEFPEHWRANAPARVDLLNDASRQRAGTTVARITAHLNAYGQQIGALRLQVRGVSPNVAAPIVVADVDLSTAQSRAALLMSMLPYFLTLSAFIGGMYLAIDTTAGERERQSLEALWLTPAPRGQIMLGKLLATATFSAASLMICVLAFAVVMPLVPTVGLGLNLSLPASSVVLMALVVLPVAVFAAAAQTLVASFAKSFREAQTYLQFLILVPAVPSLLMALSPMRAQAWMYATPLLSQSVLISELARGDAFSLIHLLSSTGTTLLAAAALGGIAMSLYRRERFALGI